MTSRDDRRVRTGPGPVSAVQPQPRACYRRQLERGTPAHPWRSNRLPRTLTAGDPRRTLFRSLLRRAEGVPVTFADGTAGTVSEVVFGVLGFDFWPQELLVTTRAGVVRVPASSVRRIGVREPRLWTTVSAVPRERGPGGRDVGDRDEQRLERLERRDDLVEVGMLAGRNRKQPESPVGVA